MSIIEDSLSNCVTLDHTELPLIEQKDCPVPLLNTTAIHAKAAIDHAFKE
mgnify:CR=1 FL=1